MVFNQTHASILQFISSIIIIVGLPSGFYLLFRMLDVIDHIKYASTEIGEGFMVGLQNGLNETITYNGKPSTVIPRTPAFLRHYGVLTLLNHLAKQITHTVVVSALIYREPQPPLLR